jgi:L-ascorbate metabolism protein UlaG (beta-lactamase superfamily)
MKYVLIVLAIFLAAAGGAAWWILSRPMFGRQPGGERLARLAASPNYVNGVFVNKSPKPALGEGANPLKMAWDFFFRKRARPAKPLPSRKTDLARLPANQDVIIWFGHSSLFMQIAGKKFLIDPNFTSFASPFKWKTYSFEGTDIYSTDEIPFIDYILITHNHFDHLNYETIQGMTGKAGKVICGLGVGSCLEYWGVPPDRIIEADWDESLALDSGIRLHVLTAHHFSGRTLGDRDKTLWASFLLETPLFSIYLGGDSGYGPHFAEIGERFGPIDLALLENGQYDLNWKYNHMQPEETLEAALDLKAKRLLPIHAGRFILANHPWDEPYLRISKLAENRGIELLTPMIGEPVYLGSADQVFTHWWENIGSEEK